MTRRPRGGWAAPTTTPAPRSHHPLPQPHDWLKDAHGNHAGARELMVAYDLDVEPHTDPVLVARAERYMEWGGTGWHDCLRAAVDDRRKGRL